MSPRLILLWILLTCTAAAAVPDWVSAAGQLTVEPGRNLAVLFNQEKVQYLTVDSVHDRQRFALRLVNGLSRAEAKFGTGYNPDTARIIRAAAWIVPPGGSRPRSFGRADFRDISASDHVMWNHGRLLIFDAAPYVEAGCTFVCEIELEARGVPEVSHGFAPALYTEQESFEVAPAIGTQITWHSTSALLPSPRAGATAGSLLWEKTRERHPGELQQPMNFLPNPESIIARAEPTGQPLTWQELSRQSAAITEPQMVLSPGLRAQAQQIVGAEPDRWARIRALSEFVQRQIVYLSLTDDTDAWAGCRPHPAPEVLANRFGDCKDKSALLLALLRAIGEDGRLLVLNLGDPRSISPDWPQLHFNHAILAIRSPSEAPADWPRLDGGPLGELVVFDPTDPNCPLGVLSGADQKGWALLLDPQNGMLLQLPEAQGSAHREDLQAVATLAGNGAVSATIDADLHGLLAASTYGARAEQRTDLTTVALTSLIRTAVPTVQDLVWHDQWAPNQATYHLHEEYKAEGFGRRLGPDLLAVSPELVPGLPPFPEWRTAREGVSWMWTGALHHHITIKLPPGYTVEELPEKWDRTGPTVSSHLAYRATDREVNCDLDFTLQPGFYDRAHYETIRKFIVKFRDAERRPILLHKTAPTGN